MKVSFDSRLWPASNTDLSTVNCEVDIASVDIDSEISRVLLWLEGELKKAVEGYKILEQFMDSGS